MQTKRRYTHIFPVLGVQSLCLIGVNPVHIHPDMLTNRVKEDALTPTHTKSVAAMLNSEHGR